ncbi:MAG TPA: hypothetical protein VF292_10540 [Rhodanobacteraceae bacterium]
MDEWPAWRRWAVLGASWALYIGGFAVALTVRSIPLRVAGVVVLCGGLWLMAYAGKAVFNERMRAADRWNMRVMLPTAAAYIVVMVYVWPLEPHIHVLWLRWVVALLPALFVAIVVWAMAHYLAHCDELERRQQFVAIGIAAGVVSIATFAFGLLAATKLVVVDAALPLLMVFPALCLVFGCVNTWMKWRNRAQ